MNKGTKNNFIIKCVLLIAVIVIGVVAIFSKAVDRKEMEMLEEDYPKTTYEILASKDFEVSYPATPSEVVKLYNKYLKYIYNTELNDDENEVLVDCLRQMWSEEWLKLNERDEHVVNMKKEAESFRNNKKVMSNYLVSESSTKREFESLNGKEGCAIISSYLYTIDKSTSKVYMLFYLLKEEDKWKILYYELCDETGNKLE